MRSSANKNMRTSVPSRPLHLYMVRRSRASHSPPSLSSDGPSTWTPSCLHGERDGGHKRGYIYKNDFMKKNIFVNKFKKKKFLPEDSMITVAASSVYCCLLQNRIPDLDPPWPNPIHQIIYLFPIFLLIFSTKNNI